MVDGLENAKVGGWYQGTPAVVIDIQRQPGANVIETVARIKHELPRLQRAMPVGIELTVVHDRTTTIRASIRDVQFTLVLSVVLVVLVVLLFLRTVRATIIAGVALPLSLIATFGVMWFAGFSLDNLSLMALTIGTGFVVDDAIVMIENIVRHIERGESAFDAALRGAREIGFTVISLTLSLIAVFIPLLFMTGLVGRMFREFALTLTIAVVVSAIVSLTLTPMMCSRILRHQAESKGNALTRFFNEAVDWTIEQYRISLEWVLRRQMLTLLTTLATLVATVWLYIIIPKGFLPPQDTGLILGVSEAGVEVSFAQMQRLQAQVETAIKSDPDVVGVVSILGVSRMNPTPNAGRLAITLRAREPAPRQRRPDRRAAQARDRADPRCHGLFPAGAGHPDQHAGEPRAVPVHAGRRQRGRRHHVVGAADRPAAHRSVAARRRLRGAGERPSHDGPCRPRHRGPARRLHAGGERRAQQRIRPAPGVDDLRPGQPVPRHSGGACRSISRTRHR